MPSKVILKITKGENAGKEFVYDSKEQLIIGRNEDCSIVLPDKTVSRYHCMMEITPLFVTVRDFGSLNGTFLNGKKIGQRERAASAEDAQKEYHEEFEMHDGDILGLSRYCEITLRTILSRHCPECGEELPDYIPADSEATVFDDTPKAFTDEEGRLICEDCRLKKEAQKNEARLAALEKERMEKKKVWAEQMKKAQLERERPEKELEEAEEERKKADKVMAEVVAQKECPGCEAMFTPKAPDNNLCPKCIEDRNKVLEVILIQALGGVIQQPQKDMGPAVIRGFRKIKRLGAGGMGEVWLVQEEATGKNYALKTMKPDVAADKSAKDSFLREALLGEALDHKNVVKVYKTGCESGVFFILMEFCQGGSVDRYMLECGGRLPVDIATYIMLQVLDGLEYAHNTDVSVKCGWRKRSAKGVVHRDLKPGNIFLADLNKFPVAKVADFGLAKAFETAGLSRHTRTGSVAGTPVFQPRQQIINFKYSKPDVDVWAAAASCYNMLTGTFPKDIRGQDVWIAMCTGSTVPIRQRNPLIPEKLAAVIDKALTEIPDIGIKTAGEFKRQIVAALPEEIKKTVRGVIL